MIKYKIFFRIAIGLFSLLIISGLVFGYLERDIFEIYAVPVEKNKSDCDFTYFAWDGFFQKLTNNKLKAFHKDDNYSIENGVIVGGPFLVTEGDMQIYNFCPKVKDSNVIKTHLPVFRYDPKSEDLNLASFKSTDFPVSIITNEIDFSIFYPDYIGVFGNNKGPDFVCLTSFRGDGKHFREMITRYFIKAHPEKILKFSTTFPLGSLPTIKDRSFIYADSNENIEIWSLENNKYTKKISGNMANKEIDQFLVYALEQQMKRVRSGNYYSFKTDP
jgi:hypothetical protein